MLITAISFPILVRDLRPSPETEAVFSGGITEKRYEAYRMALAAHRVFTRARPLKFEPVLSCIDFYQCIS